MGGGAVGPPRADVDLAGAAAVLCAGFEGTGGAVGGVITGAVETLIGVGGRTGGGTAVPCRNVQSHHKRRRTRTPMTIKSDFFLMASNRRIVS